MTLKIKMNHILLGLATIMLMLTTNAVAIAQVGEPDDIIPRFSNGEVPREQRALMDVPGGPGHLMLNAVDFQPMAMGIEWAFYNAVELYNVGTNGSGYHASVHLPDGATVNQVVMYFYDDHPGDIIAFLFRAQVGGGSQEYMAILQPTGTGGYQYETDMSILNAQIDLANYSYYVGVVFGSDAGDALRLVQVRIDYDYPTFLPTVLK